MSWMRIGGLYLFLLLLWTAYRLSFVFPEWVDELVAKPALQLIPLLLVIYGVEKRTISSIGILKSFPTRHVVMGVILGSILVSIHAGVVMLGGQSIELAASMSMQMIFMTIVISLATAVVEEIVFRGYFLTRIQKLTNSPMMSLLVSTLMFVVIHLPIAFFVLSYTPINVLIYSVLIFQTGAILGISYLMSGSLIVPIIGHLMWNGANSLFF